MAVPHHSHSLKVVAFDPGRVTYQRLEQTDGCVVIVIDLGSCCVQVETGGGGVCHHQREGFMSHALSATEREEEE